MTWCLNLQPTPYCGVSTTQATSVAAILQLQIAVYIQFIFIMFIAEKGSVAEKLFDTLSHKQWLHQGEI